MSERKLLWKKLGHYNAFVVGSIAEDGSVFFPMPYRNLLQQYADIAGVELPTDNDSADWFDGHSDLPAEYE